MTTIECYLVAPGIKGDAIAVVSLGFCHALEAGLMMPPNAVDHFINGMITALTHSPQGFNVPRIDVINNPEADVFVFNDGTLDIDISVGYHKKKSKDVNWRTV